VLSSTCFTVPTGQGKLEKVREFVQFEWPGRSVENIFRKSRGKMKNWCHQMLDFEAKCIKFDFRWGCAPDPSGGAFIVAPGPLAALNIAPQMTCFIVIINLGI